MTNRRKVTVKINNQEYTVVGEESEAYIKGIAEYVDKEFKEIYTNNERLPQFMVAILTAFNIADRYYRTSVELEQLKQDVVQPLKELNKVKEELQQKKDLVTRVDKECTNYKNSLFKANKEVEYKNKKINEQEQTLLLKEEELTKSQKIINELQNKLFENQIELVQAKKELDEFLKTFDKETNK